MVIQARMGSTRLPGKVLLDLCGRSVLERVVTRVQRAAGIDEVAIATTTKTEDDPVAALGRRLGVRVTRGPEQDVLTRYVIAARELQPDVVVRITADCPLIDPGVVTTVVRALTGGRFDFASNAIDRTFPRGLDAEAMYVDVLYRVARLATTPAAREHVCWLIYSELPKLFLIRRVRDRDDNSDLSWTVDTPTDLEHVRRIYDDEADYREIIERERRTA